jgi:hypothetical protein
MSAKDLTIGSKVWVLDEHRREYARNAEGRSFGSPLRRPMWVEWEIVDVTSRSWIAVPSYRVELYDGDLKAERSVVKIPKSHEGPTHIAASNGFRSPLVALSVEAVEDDIWAHEHGYKVLEAVRNADTATQRKIAELIGYKES